MTSSNWNRSELHCFLWAVERPFDGTDHTSPTFLYGDKLFRLKLELSREFMGKFYVLKLEPPGTAPRYGSVTVHVEDGYGLVLPFSYWKHRWDDLDRNCLIIWRYQESAIRKEIPDLHLEKLIFIITFRAEDEVQLNPPPTVQLRASVPKAKTKRILSYQKGVPCLESLSQDLSRLLTEGPPPDLVLICGDLNLKAHRIILSIRSKVFAAMLNSDMAECKTGVVKIQDMDQTAFQHFVRYLYTGRLPTLNVDIARHLYEAADRYAIPVLMRRCASFLCHNLQKDDACELLILADAHSDSDFKESVVCYILQNKIHVQQDDRWLAFCKSQPTLAIEVANRFFKHYGDK